MDSSGPDQDPEVTIEPADNGYIVRHYQRGSGKDSSGRTVRRVASTADEALEHAGTVLGGSGKTSKKKSTRSVGRSPSAEEAGDSATGSTPSASPAAGPGSAAAHSPRMRSSRRDGSGLRRRPVRSRRRV